MWFRGFYKQMFRIVDPLSRLVNDVDGALNYNYL